ncbi:tetratricopeptide repeat protein [Phenylobacterium montanum]|uniref:Tetratricopeptide repeat protein n=1 Tax=Phenylobacterium montanum TaxID=2823693 RepID=A0A975IYH2_9CAUL|nr:tetratricopeptide repeat protein [Caulobacter sp. S6]QUD90451.1 tetratricopeptide repeat protein [Caulobacter sp. S6]
MTDASPPPDDVPALLAEAQAHHAAMRLDEAEAGYRRILAREPDHPLALGLLGLILVDRPGQEAEAQAVLERHLARRPSDSAGLYSLGRLKARQGDDAGAADLFRRAMAQSPGLAPAHNELGVALNGLGRPDEALAALDQAIATDPAYGAAHANRGAVLAGLGRFGEATDAQLEALRLAPAEPVALRTSLLKTLTRTAGKAGRLDVAEAAARAEHAAHPRDPDIVELLAEVLEAEDHARDALALRNDHARQTGAQPGGATDPEAPRILLLGAVGGGHVPLRYLLDTSRFATLALGMLSHGQPDAPLGGVALASLQAVDVVFNTLGDADRDAGQLAAAKRLCAAIGKPVINPPAAILKTARDQAPRLFARIEGLVTPGVRRVSPAELAHLSIERPLLARPAGDHGGENLVLLRGDADRDAYLASEPPDTLILTDFHDFRSPDGLWRKHRIIFVDRRPYPYHLAIGRDWLVHYWRAEMARSADKKAEEERFLDDWRAVFGPRAAAATEEIGRRLNLDYAGMDCALLPSGELLLFEANACILLHLDEPEAAFPYKHRHVPQIREAFSRLVIDRAAGRG